MNSLDQLRDLHLPPPPGFWPPAPGWWVLGALVLLLAAAGLWYGLRRRRANAYRRAALARAGELAKDPDLELSALLQLVRQTALTACPATPLATLPGPDLVLQLDRVVGGRLSAALGDTVNDRRAALAARLYGPTAELAPAQRRQLVAAVRQWIRSHRRRDLSC